MKKKDICLIAGLLLIALVSYLGIRKFQGSKTVVMPSAAKTEATTQAPESATEGGTEAGAEETTEGAEATTAALEKTTEAFTEGTTEGTTEAATAAKEEQGFIWPGMEPDEKDPNAHYGIRIYAGGEYIGVYSLEEDQVIPIGETNTVEIKDGGATMVDAKCPDQLCMHMGTITNAYGLIVCLPNGVIIEGVNLAPAEDEVQIDGVS